MVTALLTPTGRRALPLALLLVQWAAVACGGGSIPTKLSHDVWQAPDVAAPEPAPVAKVLGAEGGAVEHKSGAKLKVPAGALPADVELTIQAAPPPASVEAAGTPLGAALQLGPEGQTFAVPVQIGVPVDPAAMAGLDPSELQIVLAPSAGGDFVGLDTKYDAANHQLLAETTHFSIAVPVKRKGPPLALQLPAAPPAAKVGEVYGPLDLKASGGKAPYSWSLAGGALPPGLALSPLGSVSGTPEQAGQFAASVRVKDTGGQLLEKALAFTVDGPPNAVPTLTALDPASTVVGSANLVVTVKGKEFVQGALVMVDGKGVPTKFGDSGQLAATVPAARFLSEATLQFAVVNPAPGGGTSATLPFAVTAAPIGDDAQSGDVPDGGSTGDDDAIGDSTADSDDASSDADAGADADADVASDVTPACQPQPEVCDGQDNDCNGQTDEAACDDGDLCTTNDACVDAKCAGTAKDCADSDACTVDSCNAADGKCLNPTFDGCGLPCSATTDCKDDADPCAVPACTAGKCTVLVGGAACNDGNLCTDDSCTSKSGCANTANAAPCTDGKVCVQGDTCANKACAPGKQPLCDDGNACTLDNCSESTGCSYLPTTGACDDGDGCTVGEACSDGKCQGAVAKNCDDGKACTLDSCDQSTGSCASVPIAGCGDACKAAGDCKDDGNPCTAATCVADACGVTPTTAACDDGDPCTSGDACAGGACAAGVDACDDGNACTTDSCDAKGKCTSTNAAGSCNDGDACTVFDTCKGGACKGGAAANCDDGNACTDDSCAGNLGCQHADSKTPCSDNDPCTVGDACKDAKCQPTGPKVCNDGDNCTLDGCNPVDGACDATMLDGCGGFCNTPKDCKDDGNPCTDWACPTGKCEVAYNTVPCDDKDACSDKDTCGSGKCAGSKVDCDDKNVCSDDSCDKATGCVHLANAATCTDGAVCTVSDFCKDQACQPGPDADCDDQNTCTFDKCVAGQGCVHTTGGQACSDGNPCTLDDTCVGAQCTGGSAKVCDDTNGCTADSCSPKTGACLYVKIPGCGAACKADQDCSGGLGPCLPLACSNSVCAAADSTATCDDGSICTSGDACSNGQCAGVAKDCDDANGCTADSCDGKKGCLHSELAGACEDGDFCSVMDTCQAGGTCKGGPQQQCSDGNPCTADGCDPKAGCQFANNAAPCSDGNPCTSPDACSKGACLPGDVSACDDGKGCTADTCDAKTGQCGHSDIAGCGAACQTDADCKDDGNPCTVAACASGVCAVAAVNGACDDGNPCTAGDACKGTNCLGAPATCNDGNPCTDDGCDAKTGCTHAANKAPCDSGNACTTGEICANKVCSGGQPGNCDDGNTCTFDQCSPKAGCTHTATSAPCDDGSPCSIEDECSGGTCIGGTLIPCNDGDGCTTDTCDSAKGGCVYTPLPGCGQVCTTDKDCPADDSPCTEAVCAAGVCVVAFVDQPCNDGDACSSGDLCSAGVCGGTENACDDGNACTVDTCLGAAKGCAHSAGKGACDDGSACTVGDVCVSGVCKGQGVLACDDGNPCSADSCDPNLGCTYTASKGGCDDGNPCTKGDLCANLGCQPGAVVACDDGKPCTFDACDPATGKCQSANVAGCGANCQADTDCPAPAMACAALACTAGACALAASTTACDDGNGCTLADTCQKGLCVGAPTLCDDGATCTADSCDPKLGCLHSPVGGPCDDGNDCTSGESCANGSCTGGKAIACSDANPCTDDSCKPSVGCVYLANAATCDDGDVCTTGDTCSSQYCLGDGDKDCSDGNPCTLDGCATAKGCIHAASAALCNDGDACTVGDICADNKCTAGKPADCDDKETCTADACDSKKGCTHEPKDGACDDGDTCTDGDVCLYGSCLSGQPKDCSDGKFCTTDTCANGKGCAHADNTLKCDDDDACTSGDQCSQGACVPGNAVVCDDGNPCTDDACDKAIGCTHAGNTAGCSDGNACTAGDLCVLSVCTPGKPISCDDNNPCTADKCDPQKGCALLPLDVTCTDDNACTTTDTCKDGECIAGPKPDCDDKNVCTDDSCDKAKGCVNLANTATCTDNTVCTDGDGCKDSKCAPGKVVDCDDKNPCTDDTCDAIKGCANVQSTKPCDDGDACTKNDVCAKGKCVAVAVNCDDANVCTADSCDMVKGCQNDTADLVCDDGNACTAIDKCAGLSCVAGAPVDCNDQNACTDDSCDKAKGCVNAPNTKACDDGTVCTTSDACAGGKCGGTAVNCDDNNLCTDDTCDKVDGCANTNNTKACSDGDACTTGDACAAGSCVPGAVANCDDKNACTDDSCDKAKGCQNANNTAVCNDGDACTTADKCAAGSCGGASVSCDDSSACTDDSCDKASGCKNTANNVTNCTDGNACTANDACAQGKCVGTAVACDDNVACTVDACSPQTGCKYSTNAGLCDDGNTCTTDTCDAKAGCKHAASADGTVCTSADTCAASPTCKSGACSGTPAYYRRDVGDQFTPNAMARTATGYAFAGFNAGSNIWQLRLSDLNFNTLKTINLSAYGVYSGGGVRDITVAADGTIVMAGVTQPPGKNYGPAIFAVDGNGTLLWKQNWSDTLPYHQAWGVAAIAGGYAVVYASNTCYVSVVGTDGSPKWDVTVPYPQATCQAVTTGLNGGVFVAGKRNTGTSEEVFWKHYDANGKETFSGGTHPCGNEDVNNVAFMDPTQGWFISAGCYGGNDHTLVVKVNPNGSLWGNATGLCGGNYQYCDSGRIAIDPNNNVYMTARAFKPDNTKYVAAFRLNYNIQLQNWAQLTSPQTPSGGIDVEGGPDSVAIANWYFNGGFDVGQMFKLNPTNLSAGTFPNCPTYACAGVTCDDKVACTVDTCNPATGCVYTPDNAQCDDGDLCTADSCDKVKGCLHTASTAACDDKNQCTDDTCDSIKGCANAANAAPCDDGNACTVSDACSAKACAGGPAKNCEDGLACTSHTCDTKTGCKQTANDGKCDDGKQCTVDTCDLAKGCAYAPDTKLCDDANVCTDDTCDNKTGCAHTANAAICEDGNACTVADACKSSACKPGPAKVCDDSKECTVDSCNPASGCVATNKANNVSCTPSTSCSATATCGGDGNCYDGPSKFWVKGLDVLKGGLSPNSMKLAPDGNSFYYIRNDHGGDSTATLRRADMYGNTLWEQTAFPSRMSAVVVTNSEAHFGGMRGNNANALYEIRDASNGNLKSNWEFSDPSGFAYIMDIAYEGKINNTFWAVYQAGMGSNANIKLARLDTKQTFDFYSGNQEDAPAALVFDSDVPVVVGSTKSLSGGEYQAYYQYGQFDSPHVVANGQFYDAIHMNGVWAIGYGNDGGPNYMLLARITNGLLVKKITQCDWGYSVASNGSAFWAAGGGGNIGKIAKLTMSGDVVWTNNYALPDLNGRLFAIQSYGADSILAVGSSYNGANGQTILTGVRANQDGITNCTDKNPCSALPATGCDDKVACTADACDVKQGCLHSPIDAMCDDGSPCTKNTCDGAKGCLYPLETNPPCNDKNPCTVDSCDAAAGKCVYTQDITKACGDNSVCTTDFCDKTTGCYYESVSCNDDNPCTDESAGCDAKTGCSHVSLDSKPCDDGKFCTVEDFCVNGKCLGPNVCDLPANGNLVLHLDARVSQSLVMSGKKVATWQGVKAGQAGFAGAAVFGDFNTPEVVPQAINGKNAIDLTFAHLDLAWPKKDEWTAMAVFKNDKNPSGIAKLMASSPWSINIFGVDCTLSIFNSNANGASSSTPTVPYGQPTIAVLRVTKTGATMYIYTGPQALTGSIVADYVPMGDFIQFQMRTVTLGAVQIYDKALTSAEIAAAVGDLKQDWGFAGKCKVDSDCDDADGCTKDVCDPVNGCQATPMTTQGNNTSCDDGNACSEGKNCANGVCVAATFKNCNDNNPCTADSCNPYNGKCVNVPAEGSPKCDDGNACTDEYCSSGECKKSAKICDDNNICTDDSCDPKTGCVFGANAAPCDDGNLCTSNDKCFFGKCTLSDPNTLPCNDYNVCTTADTCTGGGCVGKAVTCPDSDNNLCTVEECTPWMGCKIASIKQCYDGNPCTTDLCDVKLGICKFTNNSMPCSDNELCTVGDGCVGGKCTPGKLNNCDDLDICTADKCVSNVGCSNDYSPKCEDGSLCTVNDICAFGFCLGGEPPNCDDGNTCTTDYCSPDKGCQHNNLPDGTSCEDGVTCTQPDTCGAGACKPGTKVCDFAVTNTDDDGAGSLRMAMIGASKAVGKQTIRTFVGGNLVLKSPLPTIQTWMVIETNGETFIIDGATKYRPIFLNGMYATFKGLKFQNCSATVAGDNQLGNGLNGHGACIAIRSNAANLEWADLTLQDCSFYNGIAENSGGAIAAFSPWGYPANITMTNGSIVKCMGKGSGDTKEPANDNQWPNGGGGVHVWGAKATFTATNVRFDYNLSNGLGGALYCSGGATCTASKSSFYGGIAKDGAIATYPSATLNLTNVTISANEPANFVSGLYSLGTAVLRHVTIDGNSALTGKNQVAAYFNGPTTIVNSVLSEAGSTATELDCLAGTQAVMNVTDSLITKSKTVPGWGLDPYAKACTGAGGKPASLGSAQLEGNVRVMWPNNGSAVIDKAGLKACLAAPVSGGDELGAKRPKGNGCDIGAVEYSPLK